MKNRTIKQRIIFFTKGLVKVLVWKGIYKLLIIFLLFLGLFLPGSLVSTDTFILGGSTSVFGMFNKLNDLFRKKNTPFVYNSMGSFAAIRAVEREIFLVGFMSKAPPKDISNQIKTQFVVTDRILVIYHLPATCQIVSSTKTLDAKKETLRLIYSQYQNWNDIENVSCSQPASIKRLTRENGSGTRSVFEKKLGFKKATDYRFDNQMKSSGAVLKSVENNPGTVAYISASYEKRILTSAKVKIAINTDYLSRPFYGLYLSKNQSKVKPLFELLFCNQEIIDKVEASGFAYDSNQQNYDCETNEKK